MSRCRGKRCKNSGFRPKRCSLRNRKHAVIAVQKQVFKHTDCTAKQRMFSALFETIQSVTQRLKERCILIQTIFFNLTEYDTINRHGAVVVAFHLDRIGTLPKQRERNHIDLCHTELMSLVGPEV